MSKAEAYLKIQVQIEPTTRMATDKLSIVTGQSITKLILKYECDITCSIYAMILILSNP